MVAWKCPSISSQYQEGQGIKMKMKERIDKLIEHFITPLLCTLPKYYYYGYMWGGTFERLMNGHFQETGSFIVQK